MDVGVYNEDRSTKDNMSEFEIYIKILRMDSRLKSKKKFTH